MPDNPHDPLPLGTLLRHLVRLVVESPELDRDKQRAMLTMLDAAMRKADERREKP